MPMPLAKHRFTVDEYHRMGEAGIFHEDDRVELIHGHVVEMTPIGPAHGGCVKRLVKLFAPLAGDATLSIQDPVSLGEHEEPQPDLAVLRDRADGYAARHPRAADVLLVIEVGDTSADADRTIKIPLYAHAGIPEAWLVDLSGDWIEVYRNPAGNQYTHVDVVRRGATLSPAAFPELRIQADRILG